MRFRLASALLVVFALGALPVLSADDYGTNLQRIRSLDDPLWLDLRAVLLAAGRTELSPLPPYSDARILAELDAVDEALLPAPALLAFDRIRTALAEQGWGPVTYELRIGTVATPALEWRSDKGRPWLRDYGDARPLLAFPFELHFADTVYAFTSFDLLTDPEFRSAQPGPGLGFNLAEAALAPAGLDMTFPHRVFGSLGGSWWNFQLGRERLALGASGRYDLTLSSAAEFYDLARLSLFSESFAYTGLLVQLNPQRNLYLHRFDWRLGGGLSLGLTEASLVGEAPLELRFLNPLGIFHGFEAWSDYASTGQTYKDGSSNEVGLEATWSPFPGISLDLQYEMNQISDPLKRLFWPKEVAGIPDGEGFLARLDLRLPLETSFLVASLLGVYTTPYAYLSTGTTGADRPSGISESPVTWIYDRPSKSNFPGASGRSRAWIGMAEGPDTILGSVSLGFDGAGAWALGAELLFKAKGELSGLDSVPLLAWTDFESDPSYARKTTPTGTPEYSLVPGISVRLELPRLFPGLLPALLPDGLGARVEGALHWTGAWNADHVPGAFDQSWELFASLRLSTR